MVSNPKLILRFVLLALVVFSSTAIVAQDKTDVKAEEEFAIAFELQGKGVYNEALKIWEAQLKKFPENQFYRFNAAFCMYQLKQNMQRSIVYFQDAATNVDAKAKEKFTTTAAPAIVFYFKGKAHQELQQFDEAITSFARYLLLVGLKGDFSAEARTGLSECISAKENNYSIVAQGVGVPVSSKYNDYNFFLDTSGTKAYFTSRKLRSDYSNNNYLDGYDGLHYEDAYQVTKKPNGLWGEPTLLPFSSNGYHDNIVFVQNDTIYVSSDKSGNLDIYYTYKKDSIQWEKLKPLEIPNVNSKGNEFYFAMNASKTQLVFTSDRKGSKGGLDAYLMVKKQGVWQDPINLEGFNTSENEISIRFANQANEFYISTNGKRGFGGYDLFRVALNDDYTVRDYSNMGVPVNSPANELEINELEQGKYYFSSNRSNYQSVGGYDIYTIDINNPVKDSVVTFYGKIDGLEEEEKKLALVALHDEFGNYRLAMPKLTDGTFTFRCNISKNYEMVLSMDGIEYFSESINPLEHTSPAKTKIFMVRDWLAYNRSELKKGALAYVDTNAKYNPNYREIEMPENFNHKALDIPMRSVGKGEGLASGNSVSGGPQTSATTSDSARTDLGELTAEAVNEASSLSNEQLRKELGLGNSDINSEVIIYHQFFGFNRRHLDTKSVSFLKFIEDIVNEILDKGYVEVVLEASASKVPTKAFSNNTLLAEARAELAKRELLEYLNTIGADASQVRFVKVNAIVQGPEFDKTGQTPMMEYYKHQYVKMASFKYDFLKD